MRSPDPGLTIKQVSERTGVPPHTLRFWEKTIEGVLIPARTSSGQRRYTPEQVILVRRIKELREQGISLKRIGTLLGPKDPLRPDAGDSIDVLVARISRIIEGEIRLFLRDLNPSGLRVFSRSGKGIPPDRKAGGEHREMKGKPGEATEGRRSG